jgi:hypothetical protein
MSTLLREDPFPFRLISAHLVQVFILLYTTHACSRPYVGAFRIKTVRVKRDILPNLENAYIGFVLQHAT